MTNFASTLAKVVCHVLHIPTSERTKDQIEAIIHAVCLLEWKALYFFASMDGLLFFWLVFNLNLLSVQDVFIL